LLGEVVIRVDGDQIILENNHDLLEVLTDYGFNARLTYFLKRVKVSVGGKSFILRHNDLKGLREFLEEAAGSHGDGARLAQNSELDRRIIRAVSGIKSSETLSGFLGVLQGLKKLGDLPAFARQDLEKKFGISLLKIEQLLLERNVSKWSKPDTWNPKGRLRLLISSAQEKLRWIIDKEREQLLNALQESQELESLVTLRDEVFARNAFDLKSTTLDFNSPLVRDLSVAYTFEGDENLADLLGNVFKRLVHFYTAGSIKAILRDRTRILEKDRWNKTRVLKMRADEERIVRLSAAKLWDELASLLIDLIQSGKLDRVDYINHYLSEKGKNRTENQKQYDRNNNKNLYFFFFQKTQFF
jgi:hypothetical protein